MLTLKKIAVVFTLLFSVSYSFAANIALYSGALKLDSNITGADYLGPIAESDIQYLSFDFAGTGVDHANVYTSTNTNTNASFYSENFCNVEHANLYLSAGAVTKHYSGPDAYITTSSISTQNEKGSPGFFVEVVATQEDENIGDQVIINMSMEPTVTLDGSSCQAWIKGPNGAAQFMVALNPILDENGMPNEESIIFSEDNIISPISFSSYDEMDFPAHIGDVIAVYADFGCSITQPDSTLQSAQILVDINFETGLVTNPADINNDGFVNMLDLAELASNWLWDRSVPVIIEYPQ